MAILPLLFFCPPLAFLPLFQKVSSRSKDGGLPVQPAPSNLVLADAWNSVAGGHGPLDYDMIPKV